jgi:hypothetical protein
VIGRRSLVNNIIPISWLLPSIHCDCITFSSVTGYSGCLIAYRVIGLEMVMPLIIFMFLKV